MSEQVINKMQNYRLWQGGEYGNKLRAWRTVEEWQASGFTGKVALRTLLTTGGSGLCIYNLDAANVVHTIEVLSDRGTPRDRIMLNEMAPDDAILLQGEYLNGIYVVESNVRWSAFHYSRMKVPMRDALKDAPEDAYSLRADLLLQYAMTPSSYSDWQLLLEQYPDHVLEVSIYDRCLGDIPGRNALVWEVRRY